MPKSEFKSASGLQPEQTNVPGCFSGSSPSRLNAGCYLLLMFYLVDWGSKYWNNDTLRQARQAASTEITPTALKVANQTLRRNELQVVDAIMYNGEAVVPVRLQLLYDVVDRFYITESKVTHAGQPKPLYSVVNREVFRPFEDKITWLVYEDPPEFNMTPCLGGDNWKRENMQRQFPLQQMMKDVQEGRLDEEFVIINTDGDEVPNPEALKEFQPGGRWHDQVIAKPMYFSMTWLSYNANWVKKGNWTMGHSLPGLRTLEGKYTLQNMRNGRVSYRSPDKIPDGGWHLTYFMGVDDIVRKLESSAHQEFNKARLKSPEHIMDCIREGKDLYGRTARIQAELIFPFDATTLPETIQRFHREVLARQNLV